MSRHIWTPGEIQILIDLYPDTKSADIASVIGCNLSSVYSKASKLGLKKSDGYLASPAACRLRRGDNVGAKSRFKPGQQAWNKGKKGEFHGGKETQFRPGHRGGRAAQLYQPIGAERITKDGYRQRKVNDDMPLQSRWKFVHVIVWEEHNGPVPKSHVIVFRNGDRSQIDINNLELVHRRDLMARNTIHNLPPQLREVIDLKRHITRHINRKEKKRGQHD